MDNNEPATWHKCAAEARRIAADICHEAVREKYLRLAAGYDALARIAEARIERGLRPTQRLMPIYAASA
jgi:hypothetical protein